MLNQCPYCDDDGGVFTVVTEVTHQVYDWDGTGTYVSTVSTKEGIVQRCLSCNKIIKPRIKLQID